MRPKVDYIFLLYLFYNTKQMHVCFFLIKTPSCVKIIQTVNLNI